MTRTKTLNVYIGKGAQSATNWLYAYRIARVLAMDGLWDAHERLLLFDPLDAWMRYARWGVKALQEGEDYDFEGTLRGTIDALVERLEKGGW